MDSQNARYKTSVLRHWLVLSALALVSLVFSSNSYALVASDSSFERFMARSIGPGQIAVSVGGAGTSVAQGAPLLATTSGPLKFSRPLQLPTPSGSSIAVNAVASIPPTKLAKLLSAAFKFLPFVGTGIALYELADDLGYKVEGQGDNLAYSKFSADVCAVAPCYSYAGASNLAYKVPHSTLAGFCSGLLAFYQASNPNAAYFLNSVNATSCAFQRHPIPYTQTFSVAPVRTTVAPATSPYVPATAQDFETALAAINTWGPNAPWIKEATRDAAALNPLIISDLAPTVSLSGPASKVVNTSTTTNPDNTTTTTTTTERYTYAPDKFTADTEQKTETFNPATGATTTTTTTTATDREPTPEAKPVDPCIDNPGRLGCMTAGTAPPAEALPDTQIPFSITPVTFASSAGCPAPMSFSVPFVGTSFSISYQPLCDNLYIVKALVILLSAFVAAYIVVGGFKV